MYPRSTKASAAKGTPASADAASKAEPASPIKMTPSPSARTARAMASAIRGSLAAWLYIAPCGFTCWSSIPSERQTAASAPA